MNTVIYRIIKNWYKPVLGLLLATSPLSGVPYLYPKEFCYLPEGCPIKDGVCTGCQDQSSWGRMVGSTVIGETLTVVALCTRGTLNPPEVNLIYLRDGVPVYTDARVIRDRRGHMVWCAPGKTVVWTFPRPEGEYLIRLIDQS